MLERWDGKTPEDEPLDDHLFTEDPYIDHQNIDAFESVLMSNWIIEEPDGYKPPQEISDAKRNKRALSKGKVDFGEEGVWCKQNPDGSWVVDPNNAYDNRRDDWDKDRVTESK